jgi:hypothetical protein
MNAYQVDVLIHVNESHEIDQLSVLQDTLGRVEGVIQVRPSARPHLTWVDYNPSVTGSRTILSYVQQQGVHAQLIGM